MFGARFASRNGTKICRAMSPQAVGNRAVAANHLALIRAFCASSGSSTGPKTHSVRKIFCVAKSVARASWRAKRFIGSERGRIAFSRRDRNCDSAKTPDSSAFPHYIEFCAEKYAGEKFSAAAFRLWCSGASPANAKPGTYTQNVVE
jgi:hypothetical protein